ncbi:MAG: hypothetical protein ABJF88_08850 [Rhodothermales bacterium]
MKYIITDKPHYRRPDLHQIQAVRDIPFSSRLRGAAIRAEEFVRAGDLGGYVSSEGNLAQDGIAWIYDEAQVYDEAHVSDSARVFGDARVYNKARVCDEARVYESARVGGEAKVYQSAKISGYGSVYDSVKVSGSAKVFGSANVFGYATLYHSARIYGYAQVHGNSRVYGSAEVYGHARVNGSTEIQDNAKVFGKSGVTGEAWVREAAHLQGGVVSGRTVLAGLTVIDSTRDYLCLGPMGPNGLYYTITGDGYVFTGQRRREDRFSGTIEEFETHVDNAPRNNEFSRQFQAMLALARTWPFPVKT